MWISFEERYDIATARTSIARILRIVTNVIRNAEAKGEETYISPPSIYRSISGYYSAFRQFISVHIHDNGFSWFSIFWFSRLLAIFALLHL